MRIFGIVVQRRAILIHPWGHRTSKMTPDKLMTAAEVAEFLSVSEHTVYRWCKSRKIPHFNLNSTYRFNLQELQKWLDSKHQKGDSEKPLRNQAA